MPRQTTTLSLYAIVSRILGLVLIAAGALKGQELLQGFAGTDSRLDHAATIGIVLFELLFGLWLVLGLWPRVSWWLAAGCFVAFLKVALDRAVEGKSSCGCFGRVAIPPWYTVAFDGAAVLALACSYPLGAAPVAPRQVRRRAAVLGVVGLALLGAGAVHFATGGPRSLDGDDMIAEGETIRLTPDEWVGRPFPLARYIDGGERLKTGEWAVMFYHADCPKCRDALPLFVGLARQLADGTNSTRVALVEMPPFAVESRASGSGATYHQFRLSDRHRWLVDAPHFLLVKDGVVTKSTKAPETIPEELGLVFVAAKEEAAPRLFPDYRRLRREAFLREIACGPLALIAVLNASGIPVSPAEADQLIAEAGNEGIDLLRLKELAEQRGLHALGVEVSPDKLKRMGHKAIVRMNKVGFVAVTDYTPDGFLVTPPLRAAGILPDSVFEKGFGNEGIALLISTSPLDLEQLELGASEAASSRPGPRLRLSRSMITAGRVHRSHWRTEATIFNDGTEPLVLHSLVASCPCFTAVPDEKVIPPGGQTRLRVQGEEPGTGSFTYRLTITTNQPAHEKVVVPVRGYIEQPVGFEAPAVQFRDHLPGQPFAHEVGLDIPPGLRPEQLRVEAPAGSPLAAQVRETGPGRHVLAVQSGGVTAVGWHRWEIKVFADPAEKRIAATFHVAVEVVPEIDLSSPSAFVPDAQLGGEWSRKIVARPHPKRTAPGDWKVTWSDPQMDKGVAIESARSGEELTIILKRKAGGMPPTGRAELILVSPAGAKRSFVLYLGDAAFAAPEKK